MSWQYRIINSTCVAYAGAAYGCIDNVSDGNSFTVTGDNLSGVYQLTPGTNYVLQIMGDNSTNFDICMRGVTEMAANECGGAVGLGTAPTAYYNGGAGCLFTGPVNDATTTDLPASEYCAGSLENSEWVNFSPVAGVTSFQVIGSSIACVGGGCGYQFGIFSGLCGSLVSEGCVSNGVGCGPGPDPNLQNNENATDGYSIAWSSVGAAGFTATITRTGGAAFTGTEEFYLVMDGNAGSSCTFTLQGINVIALPVELVYFNGKKTRDGNLLEWKTSSEIENDFFIVDRSNDNRTWSSIAVIDGNGTTNDPQLYEYLDSEFQDGVNYYRLRQVDTDGQTEIHYSIAIKNELAATTIIGCYDLVGRKINLSDPGLKVIHYSDGHFEKRYD